MYKLWLCFIVSIALFFLTFLVLVPRAERKDNLEKSKMTNEKYTLKEDRAVLAILIACSVTAFSLASIPLYAQDPWPWLGVAGVCFAFGVVFALMASYAATKKVEVSKETITVKPFLKASHTFTFSDITYVRQTALFGYTIFIDGKRIISVNNDKKKPCSFFAEKVDKMKLTEAARAQGNNELFVVKQANGIKAGMAFCTFMFAVFLVGPFFLPYGFDRFEILFYCVIIGLFFLVSLGYTAFLFSWEIVGSDKGIQIHRLFWQKDIPFSSISHIEYRKISARSPLLKMVVFAKGKAVTSIPENCKGYYVLEKRFKTMNICMK